MKEWGTQYLMEYFTVLGQNLSLLIIALSSSRSGTCLGTPLERCTSQKVPFPPGRLGEVSLDSPCLSLHAGAPLLQLVGKGSLTDGNCYANTCGVSPPSVLALNVPWNSGSCPSARKGGKGSPFPTSCSLEPCLRSH